MRTGKTNRLSPTDAVRLLRAAGKKAPAAAFALTTAIHTGACRLWCDGMQVRSQIAITLAVEIDQTGAEALPAWCARGQAARRLRVATRRARSAGTSRQPPSARPAAASGLAHIGEAGSGKAEARWSLAAHSGADAGPTLRNGRRSAGPPNDARISQKSLKKFPFDLLT